MEVLVDLPCEVLRVRVDRDAVTLGRPGRSQDGSTRRATDAVAREFVRGEESVTAESLLDLVAKRSSKLFRRPAVLPEEPSESRVVAAPNHRTVVRDDPRRALEAHGQEGTAREIPRAVSPERGPHERGNGAGPSS